MIVRLGFLVTASVAVYAVKQISFKSFRPPASTTKYSENGEISSKQDQNEKGERECYIDLNSTTAKEHGEKDTGIRNAWSSNSKNPSAFDDEKEPILPEFRYHYPAKVELLFSNEKFDTTSNFQAKKDKAEYKISQDNHITEVEQLQNQLKELQGRIQKLEKKLLKSYKLKEQESKLDELRRHLKIRTAEIELLNITIDTLQEERKKLQEETEKGLSAMKQLDMAKRKISRLQSQIEIGSNQIKDQVLMLKRHVNNLQSETVTLREAKADKNVKTLEIVELEILELKRKNRELQIDKRELTLKLIAAKSKITAFSNMTEGEVVSEMQEGAKNLKIANEDLSKQIERIQESRFSVIEEMVYQRWVNACLRHEIQNHQRFSMSLGPKTQKKVKKELSEYATLDSGQGNLDLDSVSSRAPSNESEELDNTITESSTCRPIGISNKHNLIQKIKRWGESDEDSSTVSFSGSSFEGSSSSMNNLRRRSSMSMGSLEAMMLTNADALGITSIAKEQDSTESPEIPKLQHPRRVSFSDSVHYVEASLGKMSKSVEGVSVDNKHSVNNNCYKLALESDKSIKHDTKQQRSNRLADSLDLNLSSGSGAEVEGTEEICGSGDSIDQSSDTLMVDTRAVTKMKTDYSEMDRRRSKSSSKNHNKSDTQELHFVNIFYSLLLILLVYLLIQVVGFF